MKYKIFNLVFESNIAFPELTNLEQESKASIKFRFQPTRQQEFSAEKWLHQHRDSSGNLSLSLAKYPGGYLLRFPGFADFYISMGGTRIECFSHDGVDLGAVRHLLLNQVIPLLLSQSGELVLHASAAANQNQAVGFLGEAGWGKSTLCASFCQAGWELISDDSLLMRKSAGKFLCFPSFPGLRLRGETLSAFTSDAVGSPVVNQERGRNKLKFERERLNFNTSPVPVKHLYIITPPREKSTRGAVHISAMRPQEAFLELLNLTYSLDTSDAVNNRRTFENVTDVINSINIFELNYPRDMSLLPAVQAAVIEHLEE